MREIIKSKDEKFEETADDISTAAIQLHTASYCLRFSYIIKEEHGFSEIRVAVFERALLYNNHIMPFGKGTVEGIKEFCETCKDEDYEDFKKFLKFKADEAKITMKCCNLTKIFHLAILTNFKELQNKAIIWKNEKKLDDKAYRQKVNMLTTKGMTKFAAIKSLITPMFEDGNEQLEELEEHSLDFAAIDAINLLLDSINIYIDSLNKIAGFFENLYSDLDTINKRINNSNRVNSNNNPDDEQLKYFHGIIIRNADKISKSCENYIKKIPESSSNIKCIEKEYVSEYKKKFDMEYDLKRNKTDAIKWIDEAVEKNEMQDDYEIIKKERPSLISVA